MTEPVTADFGPVMTDDHYYMTLLVPEWVRNPTVVPRSDNLNEIQIRVTRCFRHDRWMIRAVGRSNNTLTAFRLLGQVQIRNPRDVRFEVHVPPPIYQDFLVRQVGQST